MSRGPAGPLLALAPLVAVVLAACAPPDRPPRLADPLPAELEAYAPPDSARTRTVVPGVWYRYLWSPRGPWAVHIAEVDLRRCELGLDVVRAQAGPGRRGGLARVTEIEDGPEDPGVLVAVNGDFFTPEGQPLGPELTDGVLRTPRPRPVLAWRPGRAPWMGRAHLEGDSMLVTGWRIPLGAGDPGSDAREGEVVGGFPQLLHQGRPVVARIVADNPGFAVTRHPRTAVGYDRRTGRLWLVVVDGRQGGYSLGMSLPELAELLEAMGATDALNLDGGGSSVMVVRGRRVTRPSDDEGERAVANALVVRHDPAAYCGR